MKQRTVAMIDIDGYALKRVLNEHGYYITDASIKIGKSAAYLSKACTAGQIPLTVTKAIEYVLHIKQDEYELKKPVIEAPVEKHLDPAVRRELLELMKQAIREVLAE